MDKIESILQAIIEENSQSVASRIKELRDSIPLSLTAFAKLVGATPKTASRWERAEGAKPSLSRVLSWKPIFGVEAPKYAPMASGRNARGPTVSSPNQVPGLYANKQVFARIIKSEEIWVLRSRSGYQVASSPEAQRVLIQQIMGPDAFKLHFVWIDPADLKEIKVGQGILPADTPRKSFQILKDYAEFAVGTKDTSPEERQKALSRIKDSIFGHELKIEQAASIGLSDSPVAILVVVYRKAEAETFGRAFDVFFEVPIELYDLTDSNRVPEGGPSWCQLSLGLARQYWNDVWDEFKVIRDRQSYKESSYTGG